MQKTANDQVYYLIDCFFWCCCSYLCLFPLLGRCADVRYLPRFASR